MRIQTVAEVTSYLEKKINTDYLLQSLWVEGVVAESGRSARGHLFFSLEDPTMSSRISCVLWASKARLFEKMIEIGATVVVSGNLNYQSAYQSLRLVADRVNIKGKSAQTLAREKMVEDLRARGFFAWERKRKLPAQPSRIGIVTSPEGAVLHDLKRMIGQRNPLVKVTVFPTRVQGAEAAQEIADAIISANAEKELCDILIIARGGGSQAELAPYDNEAVLTAAFQSRIPTISAIGHENDHPLLDLVTDVRAATPTHAAQLAVPALTEIAVAFQHTLQRLLAAWQYYDKQCIYQWHQLVRKFAQTGVTQSHLVSAQNWQRQKWHLFLVAQSLYEKEKNRQQEQKRKLTQLSPEEMFRNGYFWLEQNQHRLTSLTECHLGEELTIIGEKVSILAEVKEILKR